MAGTRKLIPFERYLLKYSEVSFHQLLEGDNIPSTPFSFTDNNYRVTTCVSSDTEQDELDSPIHSFFDEKESDVKPQIVKDDLTRKTTTRYDKKKLNEGMILRSGKVIPAVSEIDHLVKLFDDLLNIKEDPFLLEDVPSSPEVPYVTLLSGERKKFKSSNITKVAQRICSRKHDYKPRKERSPRKKLSREERLLSMNANIISIRSTPTATLYNFGRDCIQMFPRSVVQPPKPPILCGMNCGKPKSYMCTTTGVYVCSLQCYRKNLEMYKSAVKDIVEESGIHIIESESEQASTVENGDEDQSS